MTHTLDLEQVEKRESSFKNELAGCDYRDERDDVNRRYLRYLRDVVPQLVAEVRRLRGLAQR